MKAETFEKQVINSRDMLYSRALSLLKDGNLAMDLVQDTIAKSLRHRDKFREDSNLKGWLYTILKNTFINDYNRKVRNPTYYQDSYSDHLLNREQQVEHNQGVSKISLDEIHEEINKIDKRFSKPFMMHFEGYKYEEIAEELRLPVGTVKTRIHAARKQLQEAIIRSNY